LLPILLAMLAPAVASAQAGERPAPFGVAVLGDLVRARLAAYLALGLAGDADWSVDTSFGGVRGTASLDPTVGFGLRGELVASEFIAVGVLFELVTFQANANEVSNAEREALFNIDVWLKVRYDPLELNPNLDMELYAGIPVGLALGVLNQSDGSGDDVWPGINGCVLAGAMVIVDSQFGFFLELGWRGHKIFHSEDRPFIGDVASKIGTDQFALHAGAALQF
jgi:hypothetical protein